MAPQAKLGPSRHARTDRRAPWPAPERGVNAIKSLTYDAMTHGPKRIADDLWMFAYPLKMLGADLRRNVTIIRLRSGKLVIHSTGPFSPEDVARIREIGEPGWILDGILRHDTFAQEGRAAFPNIPYLAPEGFSKEVRFPTQPIVPAPAEWDGELLALEIQGAPIARDIAMLHVPSRTLILTELLFNFSGSEPGWTKFLLKIAVGSCHHPGMSRPFKWGVKDKAAFENSLATILSWDFDRVIVGHGDVIEVDGKQIVRNGLKAAGFSVP